VVEQNAENGTFRISRATDLILIPRGRQVLLSFSGEPQCWIRVPDAPY